MSSQPPTAAKMNIVAGAKPWFEFMLARGLSERTVSRSASVLIDLEKFLNQRSQTRRMQDVRLDHLLAWKRSLFRRRLAITSVDRMLQIIRSYFQWLEQQGVIFMNPAVELKIPPYVRALQYVPSESDMIRLLDSMPARTLMDLRDRALIESIYAAGLRVHELVNLNLDSIDLSNHTARVIGKGRRERVVPLTTVAVAALRTYLTEVRPKLLRNNNKQPALWITDFGQRRLSKCRAHRIVASRARRIGVKLSPQAIRRAFATHLLRHGASPFEIKELLGHAGFQHLRHYLRYAPEDLCATHRRSRLGK